MYAQAATLLTLGWWCLWRWASLSDQAQANRTRRWWLVGYAASAAAVTLTMMASGVIVATQGVCVAVVCLLLSGCHPATMHLVNPPKIEGH